MYVERNVTEIRRIPGANGADWFPEVASEAARLARRAGPEGIFKEGYFGLPLLKQPTWRWQIAWYFFLEGISAGSFLISGMSEFLAKRKLSRISRIGFYISWGALVPCPPLLIADLGDPKRFHHMLRVFKPVSPMSVGSWTLTLLGAPLTLLGAKQAAEDLGLRGRWRTALDTIPRRALIIAGIPGALTMCCYTGVLLSTTSNPLWHQSRYLGPLFASMAFSTGISAITLATGLAGENGDWLKMLRPVHKLSTTMELSAIGAYLAGTRKSAAPVFKGRKAALLCAGIACLAAPLVFRKLSSRRSERKRLEIAAAALALAGGLALKWAVVYGGRTSAVESNSAQIAAITNHSQ